MMLTALMSDVHGNAAALEAVLDDARDAGADDVVCLGDIAEGGPEPARCVALVRESAAAAIIGNCDGWLFNFDPAGVPPARAATGRWAIAELGEDGLAWLRGLPFSHRRDA